MSSLGRVGAWRMWAAALALAAAGCARPAGRITLLAHKDPAAPLSYVTRFEQCAYRRDPAGDYHFVARSSRLPRPGVGGPVTQLLYVHLFWKPYPGKTFANRTCHDATLRYLIVTDEGTLAYAGTGFAFPRRRLLSRELVVELEKARLRLEARVGRAPELLGEARLSGRLRAEEDPNLAVDVLRELELRAAGATRSPAVSRSPDKLPGRPAGR